MQNSNVDLGNNGIVSPLQCLCAHNKDNGGRKGAPRKQSKTGWPQWAGKLIERLHHSDTHVLAHTERAKFCWRTRYEEISKGIFVFGKGGERFR